MEWGILASIVAVISPLFLVIVTYVKTWSRFEVTVNNLSICVDKLTQLVDEFCQRYNAVVFCEHISNYCGNFKAASKFSASC